jgi:diaminohydroxyphosphoribosylaminopyrimidine deaminase/5-amino-6-(5-phosphoribosylamino)uracil reductase
MDSLPENDPSEFSAFDYAMMSQALRLAKLGQYTVAPNPQVGCVITLDGQIIGQGQHQQAGTAHAEVHALTQVTELVQKGELLRAQLAYACAYVTLEPCSHTGRTGPCADALIDAGIGHVIVAMQDPFVQVAGRGIAKLQAAGVKVKVGLLETEARNINRHFLSIVERQRPFVTAKIATSLDGKIALANGVSKWITQAPARQDVQRHRAQYACILTGSQTVMHDDPQLNVRLDDAPTDVLQALALNPMAEFTQPLRAIIDSHSKLDDKYQIIGKATPATPTYVFNASNTRLSADGKCDLHDVMAQLAQRQINSVWVEAGAGLVGALIAAQLVDELIIYQAPMLLGDAAKDAVQLPTLTAMTQRIELDITDTRMIGRDIKHTCSVIYPKG